MSTSTPGPFALDFDSLETGIWIIGADGKIVADIWPHEDVDRKCVHPLREDAVAVANANLLCAAPDLLDACEEALLIIGQRDDLWPNTQAQLQAAIAKAKGGAQ